MATTRFIDHLLEGDHASRPAFGDVPQGTLYACSDHDLIYQSDGSSAWSTWANVSGSGGDVATDAIWDAAGDLAVGSGANTAAKLAAGSEGEVLTIASGVPSWEAAAGGGSASLLLAYVPSSDIMAGVALTSNTWADVCSNQNFTVASGGSGLVQVSASLGLTNIAASVAGSAGCRMVIDSAGTPIYHMFGGNPITFSTSEPVHGAASVVVSGLSAAVHTIKVQVISNGKNGTGYCRPSSFPNAEFLSVHVTQLP